MQKIDRINIYKTHLFFLYSLIFIEKKLKNLILFNEIIIIKHMINISLLLTSKLTSKVSLDKRTEF
jgi:hypothetical protein